MHVICERDGIKHDPLSMIQEHVGLERNTRENR
jgi:hypothetical protein